MLNECILCGRLTSVHEPKTTAKGTSVVTFCIAVERDFKDAEGIYPTDFINCVAWRSTADFISKYFTRGQMITVKGSIQTRNYQTKNGDKRTATEIIVEKAYFCGSKQDSAQQNEEPAFENASDDDDDLPF